MAYNVLKGSVSNAIASSGADVGLTTSNTSDTASSTATLYATVAGTSSGDARVQYAVTGTTTWTEGIDNSDGDAYVLAASNALGSSNVMRASTAGELNYPLQPAFLAYLGATDSDVTGNSTVWTLGSGTALTEVYDQGGDFVTTGTFTAPVTGRYYFNVLMRIGGVVASTNGNLRIVTSNTSYNNIGNGSPVNVKSSGAGWIPYGSVFTDMDAADTTTFAAFVSGEGADVCDVIGSASTAFCSGYLVC